MLKLQSLIYFSAIVSIFFNIILVVIIAHPKSKIIGNYRFLLLSFAALDITTSMTGVTVQPVSFGHPHTRSEVASTKIQKN